MNPPTPSTLAQIAAIRAEIELEKARFSEMLTIYAMVKQQARIKELQEQLELPEKAVNDYGQV